MKILILLIKSPIKAVSAEGEHTCSYMWQWCLSGTSTASGQADGEDGGKKKGWKQ